MVSLWGMPEVYNINSWYLLNSTGSCGNTWWFGNTTVSGIVGVRNLSLSALLVRLKAFQLPWSAGLSSIGLSLWRRISETTILSSWLRGYFVGTSIFIGTTVSLGTILYCCGWETSKQRLQQKEILLRTWNVCVRLFVRSSRRSASRNAIALRMSDRTVRRILQGDLNFHPYKMVMVKAMNDQDIVNWKTLCEVLLNTLDNDILDHVLMMDEANFHICGNVNSQNCPFWAAENPRGIHQKTLRSEKFIVFCGVASYGVTGPYFFEDKACRAVTVNSARYTEMLRTFLELDL